MINKNDGVKIFIGSWIFDSLARGIEKLLEGSGELTLGEHEALSKFLKAMKEV